MSSKLNNPRSEVHLQPDHSSLITYHLDTEKGGWFKNNLIIKHLQDGALSIRSEDGSDFIYIYPEQLPHVKRLLEINS